MNKLINYLFFKLGRAKSSVGPYYHARAARQDEVKKFILFACMIFFKLECTGTIHRKIYFDLQ